VYTNNCPLGICRKAHPIYEEGPSKEVRNKFKQKKNNEKVYVQTKDGRVEQGNKNKEINIENLANKGANNINNVIADAAQPADVEEAADMMQVQKRDVTTDLEIEPPVEQLNRYSVLQDQELELNEVNNGDKVNDEAQKNMNNFT